MIEPLDDATGWQPTRCAGWTVRDLVYHLVGDAQRALVAVHTPTAAEADVDAVTYWANWKPGTPELWPACAASGSWPAPGAA